MCYFGQTILFLVDYEIALRSSKLELLIEYDGGTNTK